jgi:hypothetical protein
LQQTPSSRLMTPKPPQLKERHPLQRTPKHPTQE